MEIQIGQIPIPEHQRILENQNKYSIQDVILAKKHAKIEQEDAKRIGITVEALRLKKLIASKELNAKIVEHENAVEKLKNADVYEFGDTCFHFLIENCKNNGSEFRTDVKKDMDMYREIIRYLHWDSQCDKLDKKRHLFMFGVYGCGKSIAVKSIYKALEYHKHNEWEYFHLPTITKNYMAQAGSKSNNAFEPLFSCSKNMIIDEIGDKSEKQKSYGNEIESVRSLILDKYDKWVSNNQNKGSQKIVFTSNLFPDMNYFFTKSSEDNRPTLRNFYDDKVYNKMIEMCNLLRFPNVSYRVYNRVEFL